MKGRNTFHLNQATMLEAIQLWLDKSFKEPPLAASVGVEEPGRANGVKVPDCFVVNIEERKDVGTES